jgi:tRNA(fMet)-specific endonuclease VapC
LKYFLDTNICIYFLKGMFPGIKKQLLSNQPENIKIASMVKAELLYGAAKSNRVDENTQKVMEFLLPYEIVSFDDAASVEYSGIRNDLETKGMIIGPNDLIISAIVKSNNGILITNNEKEFDRIKDLQIENWCI